MLSLRGVTATGGAVDVHLDDLDLQVRRGEFVGIAGVAGNGQRELMELLAGLRPITSGRMHASDVDVTDGRVDERIRAGVAAHDPITGELVGLPAGTTTVQVTVNQSSATRRVTID